ncbi:hypothetical protein DFQ26_002705 [Actinomortierella ambigua]|nr:hypothetical protein DFQ26_002705 [Actinomortierella ambigua]
MPTEEDPLLHPPSKGGRKADTLATTTAHARPRRRASASLLKRHLTTLDIARLTICMLGVQFTWTVELGYGTPYLLSLGMPKALTPLVWLAGPLSGLIIQPLVGVFSDTLDWRMGRRRPFIIGGAVLTVLSMLLVAYAHDIAERIVGHPPGHKAPRMMMMTTTSAMDDWTTKGGGGHHGKDTPNQEMEAAIKNWTMGLAVLGFYSLDFSINAVQACCRSLIMDIPRTDQQEVGNAWSGWMNNLGSVAGFFAGNLDLVYCLPWLGDQQIKVLANLAILFLTTTLAITCLSVTEIPYERSVADEARTVCGAIADIWYAFRHLPAAVQRVCNVQFFAWMGWFPFLFYVTTWVGEILNRYVEDPNESLPANGAERAGSFALLCWATVAVLSGILIPKLTPKEVGLARWPKNPFTVKNLWTMSLVWFAGCMALTWFVDDLWAATAVVALCGVPWAVAMWVPFAMVGEYLSGRKDRRAQRELMKKGALQVESRDQQQPRRLSEGGDLDYGTVKSDGHGGGGGESSSQAIGVGPQEGSSRRSSPATTMLADDMETAEVLATPQSNPSDSHMHANALEQGVYSPRPRSASHSQSRSGSVSGLLPGRRIGDSTTEDDDDDDDDEEEEEEEREGGNENARNEGGQLAVHRRKRRNSCHASSTHRPEIDSGLVLGVHNMYIVFPQFVDALVASTLFAIIGTRRTPPHLPDPEPRLPPPDDGPGGVGGWMNMLLTMAPGDPEPVGWVLRFGGVMALVAAFLSRRL